MIVIGIVGKLKSGKTTVADYLVKHKSFTRLAFADPIKQMVSALFGYNDRHKSGVHRYPSNKEIHSAINKLSSWLVGMQMAALTASEKDKIEDCFRHEKTKVYRLLLQRIATDIVRARDEHIWVKSMFIRLLALRNSANIVIDDVRFNIESDLIRVGFGGHTVKIVRNVVTDDKLVTTHVSETELDTIKCDYTIHNTYNTREQLYRDVDNMLKFITTRNDYTFNSVTHAQNSQSSGSVIQSIS